MSSLMKTGQWVAIIAEMGLAGAAAASLHATSFRHPIENPMVGGYQVCEKWLKDRKGLTLDYADFQHYQKIVVALRETMRLMPAIDQTIEAHGGWPGAFGDVGNHFRNIAWLDRACASRREI